MDNIIEQIKIIKLSLDYLEECNEILQRSILADVYFQNKNTYNIIKKSIGIDEIYIALYNSNCIGFVWCNMYGAFDKYPYLHMIVVDEAYRNMGIGKLLMSFFENEICKDYDKMLLMVGYFNPNAKRLYESIGYETIGTLKSFYKENVNEYLMMKSKSN